MARRTRPRSYWGVQTPSLSSWTVSTVRAALNEHETGVFYNSAHLAEAMERNPRIMGALNTRVRGVFGLPLVVEPAHFGGRRATAIAADLEARWYDVAPEAAAGKLVRWYVTLGVGIAERVWTTIGGVWQPRLRPIPSMALVRWDDHLEHYVVQTRDGEAVVDPDDDWYVLEAEEGRAWLRGVVRCLGLEDKIRTEAVRDWARWSEKHGLPIVEAKVPASAKDSDKDDFFASLSALGSESTVMSPQGATEQESFGIALHEVRDRSWEGFEKLLAMVANDVEIAITGQNNTSEKSTGSYAKAKVLDRVRIDYLEADAEALATADYQQLARPWAAFNYGDDRLAPWPRRNATAPEDQAEKAKMLNELGDALAKLHAAGIDVGPVIESFGLKLASKAEMPPQSDHARTGTEG
jgi:phage gp29-like protein